MKSIKLNIKTLSEGRKFLEEKQEEYSHVKRCLYRRATAHSKRQDAQKMAQNQHGMSAVEAYSVTSEVFTLFKKTQAQKDDCAEKILDLQKKIKELEGKVENDTKKEEYRKRDLFKFKNKMAELEASLVRDITFGGKEALRKLSYLSNVVQKPINPKLSKEKKREAVREKQEQKKRLEEAKKAYRKKRKHTVYVVGNSADKGSLLFDFDLPGGKIYYKPKKGIRIELSFSDKRKDLLADLQFYIDNCAIPITVHLSSTNISLSYDDVTLAGFGIDESERKKECDEIKRKKFSEEEEGVFIRQVCRKYHQEQDAKMMRGKREGRFMAFDSNPNHIGIAVVDKKGEEMEFVTAWYYDLTEMNRKMPKGSTVEERLRQTNKRKHGILHVWKDVFEQATYLKVGTFVREKLDLKGKEKAVAKEANRQTRNIWHRELSRQTINSHCTKIGIKVVEVNPAYSSTIGNINHSLVDCVNAALELGRRGAFCFIKGTHFPPISETGLHATRRMNLHSRDVEVLEGCSSWKELHGVIKKKRLRYRRTLRDLTLSEQEDATHLCSAKLRYAGIDKHVFHKKPCLSVSPII